MWRSRGLGWECNAYKSYFDYPGCFPNTEVSPENLFMRIDYWYKIFQ